MNTKAGKTIVGIVVLLVLAAAAWFAISAYTGSQSKAQDELAQPDPSAPKGHSKQAKP